MHICASSITALLRHAASPPPIKRMYYAYDREHATCPKLKSSVCDDT